MKLLPLLIAMSFPASGGEVEFKAVIPCHQVWHKKEKFFDWYPETYIVLTYYHSEFDEYGNEERYCDVHYVTLEQYESIYVGSYYYFPE